jgi:thiol:disulfide interchange protein
MVTLAMVSLAGVTSAQDGFGVGGVGSGDDVFGGINFGALNDQQEQPIRWGARYVAEGQRGRLEIEATLGKGWHIYSTTQPPGGPLPTKFSIASPKTVSLAGKFQPDQPPTESVSEVYPGVTIEEHGDAVVWSAPINLPAGFQDAIEVDVKSLVCQTDGSCMPSNETLTAEYAGAMKSKPAATDDTAPTGSKPDAAPSAADLLADQAARTAEFQDGGYEVKWTAGVSAAIAAGGRGVLVFRAAPEAAYHVYQAVVDDAESSTNFVVTKKAGLKIGEPDADKPIVSKSLLPSIPGLPEAPPVKFHEGAVTWALPIEVPAGTDPGDYDIEGFVGYQACTDSSCLQPKAFAFTATVTVAEQTDATLEPIEIQAAKYATAIDAAASTDWVDPLRPDESATVEDGAESQPQGDGQASQDASQDPAGPVDDRTAAIGGGVDDRPSVDEDDLAAAAKPSKPRASMPLILLMALGGGLILNLMPCVLPVVGLKIMSFVHQAGEDRKRVFVLNFAYVAGILAVFAGLTALAVFASFGWGQQFTYFPVRLGLTVMIFALALSYLGVWELPTPGVGTGKKSQELQDREGFTGAFFKGAFATILATPCSGPLLGVVLGYTITLQPIQTAAVMMTVGIGMALPYIILGLFPSAVGFLPKPGNWMVTLKEFLAFLFLGTVAFFFNQFSDADKLPVFVTLIGVWFGCWIIGKVPPWESMHKQVRGWSMGIASAIAIGWFSFNYLTENAPQNVASVDGQSVEYIVDNHLRWEKYSEPRLRELQAQGKTVMLDFTAAWCTNCFVNKKVALDTEATSDLLEKLDAVPMLADWTDQNEQIESKLRELDSKSIPVLAIYPGNNPDDPIVLRDLVSQATVLDALAKAGPSVNATDAPGRRGAETRYTSAAVGGRQAAPADKH